MRGLVEARRVGRVTLDVVGRAQRRRPRGSSRNQHEQDEAEERQADESQRPAIEVGAAAQPEDSGGNVGHEEERRVGDARDEVVPADSARTGASGAPGARPWADGRRRETGRLRSVDATTSACRLRLPARAGSRRRRRTSPNGKKSTKPTPATPGDARSKMLPSPTTSQRSRRSRTCNRQPVHMPVLDLKTRHRPAPSCIAQLSRHAQEAYREAPNPPARARPAAASTVACPARTLCRRRRAFSGLRYGRHDPLRRRSNTWEPDAHVLRLRSLEWRKQGRRLRSAARPANLLRVRRSRRRS